MDKQNNDGGSSDDIDINHMQRGDDGGGTIEWSEVGEKTLRLSPEDRFADQLRAVAALVSPKAWNNLRSMPSFVESSARSSIGARY
jgi:hypothetical protein